MAPWGSKYQRVAGDANHDQLPHDKDARDMIDADGLRRRPVKRAIRWFLSLAVLSFLFAGICPSSVRDSYGRVSHGLQRPPKTLHEKARHILSGSPLIDGHVDFPILVRAMYNNHIYDKDFQEGFENGGLKGHVDLKRLREGLSGGAFWSVFAPCPANHTDYSDENYASAVQWTLSAIDLMTRVQDRYSSEFSQQLDSSGAMKAFREGKLISPLGVEGLHQIGNKVSNLRLYRDLGVRYATLTHNCHNNFADAALVGMNPEVAKPKWGGVSPLGQRVVHEMNRIGMIVDLAHVSDDTMRDVLGGKGDWEGSIAPPIYSHSSAYSICPHPRNVKDDILELVKRRNSVVMVNIAPQFISCRTSDSDPSGMPEYVPEEATLDQVVKHIMHIGELIGYEHVGIGTDFDGIEDVPKGLEDVSKYPDLVAALLEKGVSASDIRGIIGGNVLRVWAEVDRVAAVMQATMAPIMEDDEPDLFDTANIQG